MKTLQSFAEILSYNNGIEEDILQLEVIKQKILSLRQMFIQRDYARSRKIPPQLVQTFNIQLTKVQEGEDKFYISSSLPKPIILLNTDTPFSGVYTQFQGRTKQPLDYLPPERIPYIKYRKFTSDGNFYTYENDKIVSLAPAAFIRIAAVWDDPIAVFNFAKAEALQLACSEDTIDSPCIEDNELIIEETLSGRILTIWNNSNVEDSESA